MKQVTGAELLFCAYSSKYNRFLKGDIAPAFQLEANGGVIQDFGPYVLYSAIAWFGIPQNSKYIMRKLPTGVDGSGIILLNYDKFDVTIRISKIEETHQDSEVYGDGHTLVIHTVSLMNSVKDFDSTADKDMGFHAEEEEMPSEQLAKPRSSQNPLIDEINFFTEQILGNTGKPIHCQKSYSEITELTRSVLALGEKLRTEAGVIFPE
jgi:predicted dehydrogenase